MHSPSNDPPEPEDDGFLEMFFSCLRLYHSYQQTGELPEGVSVTQSDDGVTAFSTNGSFTEQDGCSVVLSKLSMMPLAVIFFGEAIDSIAGTTISEPAHYACAGPLPSKVQ